MAVRFGATRYARSSESTGTQDVLTGRDTTTTEGAADPAVLRAALGLAGGTLDGSDLPQSNA